MCYFSIAGEVFYDGMQEALSNAGNDIFRFNAFNHISYTEWGKNFTLNKKGVGVLPKIENFSPDLILSFNAFLPEELIHITNCPICLLDADNPKYFWHKNYIKQNKDKFYYLGTQKKSLDIYKEHFNIDEQQYLYFPAATSLENKKVKQDKNISFIGSHFITQKYKNMEYLTNIEYLPMVKKILTINPSDLFINLDKTKGNLLKNSNTEVDDLEFVVDKLFDESQHVAGIHRTQFLSQISDLGLTIYGPKSWVNLIPYYPDVAICYTPEVVITAEENENVYNSSKISVNISHPQDVLGFSWRVMDIMAANSCLVMEKKPDWEDLFGEYISKEVKEAILYNDRYDCREKIKNLLNNEILRLKCVEECQHAIEKNGRWEHRFRDLANFIGIDLTSKKGKGTVISIIDEACYTQKNIDQKRKIPKLVRFFKLRQHFLEIFIKSPLGFLGYHGIVHSMKKNLGRIDKYRGKNEN